MISHIATTLSLVLVASTSLQAVAQPSDSAKACFDSDLAFEIETTSNILIARADQLARTAVKVPDTPAESIYYITRQLVLIERIKNRVTPIPRGRP